VRVHQELVDAVIDCTGAGCAEKFAVGQLFQSTTNEGERSLLKSLALASRACNHRARSHLFARCNFADSDSGAFDRFRQCPDALLRYTRVLAIRYGHDSTTILAVLRRFTSPGQKPGLSCLMFQRSADLGLGIPFNIASYALLTHMIAHVIDTEARELIIQLGDAHVYRDHVEALQVQLERQPYPFPTIKWRRKVEVIDKFESEDIIVEGYRSHPTIATKMSV